MSKALMLRARPRGWGSFLPLALVALLILPLALPPGALALAGSITGTVTDPGGGLPPPGTVVKLLRADHTAFGQTSVEPTDGSFAFGAVPTGNYILRAVPPQPSPLTPSEPVAVSILGAPVDVGFVPLTEPSILGTVYAPDGTTPADAWVHVQSAGHASENVPAPGGEIRIGGLPAGTYWLQAWPAGDEPYWTSERLLVTVTAGVTETISPTLAAADVYGRAVDPLGQPVKEAIARVVDASGQVVGRDLTSTSGFFAIGGLPDGNYQLTLEPPWWQPAFLPPEPVPFSVPPAQNVGPVAFRASPKVVQGQAETNTGVPVGNALVNAHRLDKAGHVHALSGAGGLYSIHLTEGLWALTVEPISTTVPANWVYLHGPQLVHFQHDTTPEHRNVDFEVITADSRVTGSVEMPGGGVPTFTVTVGIHTDAGLGRSQAIDPADGTFDIPVPHGSYKVIVQAADEQYMGPPVDPIRVLPNSTYDLGTLALLERNATISGLVTGGGSPVGDVPIVAWRPDAAGGADTRTGPDGNYVLPVVEGTWLVKPAPVPEQPWLYAGSPVEIEMPNGGAVGGIDFELTATNAEIHGQLVDEAGTPLTGVEGWAHAVNSAEPAVQKGAPVEDGAFTLLVPAGTYHVSLKLPPGAPWLPAPVRNVEVGSGGTTSVTLTLRARDATIAGALWNQRAEETVTGVQAQVLAFSEGAWLRTAVDPGNGVYKLQVASGIWALGYKVDPGSAYVALRHRRNYPVASGQTVPAPLPVAEKDGLVGGIVRDPDGAPLAGATVVADGQGPYLGDLHLHTTTGDDGRFRLHLPHGHYLVRATVGVDSNWIHPASLNVIVQQGGSVTGLDLQFLKPDATIGGTVNLAAAAEVEANHLVHLWVYSPHDGYTKAQAELGGLYSLDVISNTTWIVGAAYQEGNQYWRTRAQVEVPPGGATRDLALEGPFPLPAPVTVQFDAAQEQYVELADGTSIYVPAGAMPTSGTVTLHITPIATFPHQRHANVYRYGYAFTAVDAGGQPIEERFNQEVLITFPYDEAELQHMGISEQWLKPAYFSTTTDSWTFPETYVVDTQANLVAMGIDHFTGFALTGSDGYKIFLPLIVR